jgi:hypothetical protein
VAKDYRDPCRLPLCTIVSFVVNAFRCSKGPQKSRVPNREMPVVFSRFALDFQADFELILYLYTQPRDNPKNR